MCSRGEVRASLGPWTKGEKRQPIGNSDHCTGWCQDDVCQDDVLPLQVAEDISSMSCLDTQGFEGEPRAGVCWWSGTPSWDTSLAWREADHSVAGISTWSPLRAGMYGFAAGKASFLKCVSSSRSLTIEALIKAEINFVSARAEHSLYFSFRSHVRSLVQNAPQGGGSSAGKNEAPESVCDAGDQQLLEKQLYP